ncbi:MAG: hypothetical protein JWQ11_356 [Rhizobacter sp.]|nr:hypothetical protein [Rhizobacter sp.]
MHQSSLAPVGDFLQPGLDARHGGADRLARALRACRQDTLATFAACQQSRADLRVPQQEALNPPVWELGHLGWFQEYWIARNPQRVFGAAADPFAPRLPGVRIGADALYDSGLVPHATRWSLPLPDVDGTRADLRAQLDATLALLAAIGPDDQRSLDALYFFRLALLHEDMHHEAALYMAQSLGLPIEDARWQPRALPSASSPIEFAAASFELGSGSAGFAFDNELGAHLVALPATSIDSRVVRWADYLPFVEAGGYADERWWSDAGRAWLGAAQATAPRYLRREGPMEWASWRHGRWSPLDTSLAACHLTAFEAEAFCRWAGRRLPTEAEWERAAVERPDAFAWGQVWEWTASRFEPYPGFTPHPYRDYSAPWFGDRPVLRGASFMTQPRMRHPRYRNFFMAHRNDVPAGFRTCEP